VQILLQIQNGNLIAGEDKIIWKFTYLHGNFDFKLHETQFGMMGITFDPNICDYFSINT